MVKSTTYKTTNNHSPSLSSTRSNGTIDGHHPQHYCKHEYNEHDYKVVKGYGITRQEEFFSSVKVLWDYHPMWCLLYTWTSLYGALLDSDSFVVLARPRVLLQSLVTWERSSEIVISSWISFIGSKQEGQEGSLPRTLEQSLTCKLGQLWGKLAPQGQVPHLSSGQKLVSLLVHWQSEADRGCIEALQPTPRLPS